MNIKVNVKLLLSDTKLPEDHIQDILDVDAPKQTSERKCRRPQILCCKFLAPREHVYTALQRSGRLPQQLPLALPGDQTALTLPEKLLRENDQSRDQPGEAVATRR